MSRWQAKLEYKQVFLARIVDIGAELFAIAAACTRAEMLRIDNPEQGETAYALADVCCEHARLRVEGLFDRLWSNTDDLDEQISARVLDGDFTWLEQGVLDQSEGTGPWISPWDSWAEPERLGAPCGALSPCSDRGRRVRSRR